MLAGNTGHKYHGRDAPPQLDETLQSGCSLWLAILWNSAFKWVYLSFSLLPLASLLFLANCKASSDNHFAFLHFFFLGMVLITASCTLLCWGEDVKHSGWE